MKRRPLLFLGIFAAVTLHTFLLIGLDLAFNPWLRNVVQEWEWHNYFTSHHGLTVLYLINGWLYLVISIIISALTAFFFTIPFKR